MVKKKVKAVKKKKVNFAVMGFLKICGWTILVILIVGSALSYFGVLKTEEENTIITDYEPLCEKYCRDVRQELYGDKCIEVDNETIEVVCDTCTNIVSRRIGVKKSYLESLK